MRIFGALFTRPRDFYSPLICWAAQRLGCVGRWWGRSTDQLWFEYDIKESQVVFLFPPYKWAIIAFRTAVRAPELLLSLDALPWKCDKSNHRSSSATVRLVWCFLCVVLIIRFTLILVPRHHTRGGERRWFWNRAKIFSLLAGGRKKQTSPPWSACTDKPGHPPGPLQRCAALFSPASEQEWPFYSSEDAFTEPLCTEWLLPIKAHKNRTKTSKWVSSARCVRSVKTLFFPVVSFQSCAPNCRKLPPLCRLSNLLSSDWTSSDLTAASWGSRDNKIDVESAHESGSATIRKDSKAEL